MGLPAQQQNEVELEIAAFMGPHIKRARIVLVLIGALYLLSGYMNYSDVSKLRDMVNSWPGGAGLDELKHQVSLAYAAVIIVIVIGVANIVLSAIAGVKTMFAFYAAMGLFAIHSVFLLYATGGAIVTNIIWWITAICLGMGFQAALKADKLRKGQRPAAAL